MFNRQGLGLPWGGGVASPLAHTRRVTALASGRLDTEASDGPFGSTSIDRRRQPRTTGHNQARSLTQPPVHPPEQAGCRCRIESNRSPRDRSRSIVHQRPSAIVSYHIVRYSERPQDSASRVARSKQASQPASQPASRLISKRAGERQEQENVGRQGGRGPDRQRAGGFVSCVLYVYALWGVYGGSTPSHST